ncbi:polyprenyl synthetase family protein [uncultured Gemella sp.]|uniref:polyprenyl synthetase family protein n=1 Tax=uncultured Gemella sp. TaxID=254352 RepID=UPI0028D7CB32|nr:polyprenyl synthetase family protein [uncultured Gemella sp.]
MFKINENEKNFLNNVDELINTYIQTLPPQYLNFIQLKNGNKLRPLLVYYGFTLHSSKINKRLINIAYSIELIHKASTIIDDIIDEDIKRRGFDACHVQHSINEAIILSIHMLGEAFSKLYDEIHINNIISMMIKNMCIGTLKELNISTYTNSDEITEIINLQTTGIIKNCLLIGFTLNTTDIDYNDIEILGSKLGYLFQLLNDCESIFNLEFINANKGNYNFDYNKIRKNICITYLQSYLNRRDIETMHTLTPSSISKLFKKYKIKDHILSEISYIKKDIYSILDELSHRYNIYRLKCCIDYTIAVAEKRANI